MPATLVQTKGATGNTTAPTVVTLDSAATNGNLIEVSVITRQPSGGGVTLGVTDSAGNTYTQAVASPSVFSGSFERFTIKYYAKNISGSPTTVTATASATLGGNLTVIVAEYSGLDTSSPLDKTAIGNGSSGTVIVTASSGTLSQADELVTCSVYSGLSGLTKGASYTLNAMQANNGDEYKVVSATTAVTGDWTGGSSGNWRVALATYKIAAGGGTALPVLLHSHREQGICA